MIGLGRGWEDGLTLGIFVEANHLWMWVGMRREMVQKEDD